MSGAYSCLRSSEGACVDVFFWTGGGGVRGRVRGGGVPCINACHTGREWPLTLHPYKMPGRSDVPFFFATQAAFYKNI